MTLQRGLPLLLQQYTALFKKNLLLSWRSKRATFLQLFASFFFILLIFCIQAAMEKSFASSTALKTVTDPTALISPPIPPCEDKFFVNLPCYDFVWSGNRSSKVTQIVNAIMKNNPGRSIPIEKVRSFVDPEAVDTWLMANPLLVPGALHFIERNATVISYGIQTNSTPEMNRGRFEDPTFKFQIPLQIAAEREIARSLIGDPNFNWVVGFKEFPHPTIEAIVALDTIGPTFFLAVAMFGFVLQISSLITEKELKLRQAMTMMGVFDTAYWLSWLTWEGILTAISALLTVLFGMMFQFDFFLKNSFPVVFLLFMLFQFNLIGLAFMLSAFISKSTSATTVGFFVFLVGFVTQLATSSGFPYAKKYSRMIRALWSLFPPNTFSQGLKLLADATSTPQDPGISWSKRAECGPNDDTGCVLTINDIYLWLLGTFFLWFVLALYFDNITPNASGVRKSIFYFLKPGYWTGKGGNRVEEGGICSCIGSVPPVDHITPDDEDVLEEETLVKQHSMEGLVDPNVAVQIRGLAKTYPGTTKFGCCKCKKTSPFHALKGLWMNIAKDQLFCLLGPNGAGKTTTINCLTGLFPVTGGDALIYGNSIRSSVGMSNIRKMIGVCPQFDILWDALSGEEHLKLFASIKGLPPSSINSMVEKSLAEVKLTEAGKIRAGSYSGGMKRRLSVAVSLIGDPKLVFLDEPTTGMDPITRRHVWDIIQETKKGRAIILTTHSMEEADILSDRIGIMAKGRLRCIGTSIRLKSRFGTGFIANISFVESNNHNGEAGSDSREPVKKFFKDHLKVKPIEENKAFMTFVIPHDKENLLTSFFAELQDREEEFGISDIQLGLATLEEVFLNIARKAELESAAVDGTMVTLDLTSGSSVEIPVGARFIGIPGTETAENPRGVMVEVYWQQDESGSLCISGHSTEMPIPENIPVTDPVAPGHGGVNLLGRRGRRQVQGIVIDPEFATFTRSGSTSSRRFSRSGSSRRFSS
ncbi:ABC transporter A family member 2 [Arabidopsis thaliana]|jgi:ABC-type multidrug transport system ATPase subunit|uniref:ABC transporter A family member 2 n=4 Tax=Arabidopsis TaxID=3701 RepID=AB2A_ARATH|nr:ATP-binding cassette A2 [Arabidopsis thaliana]Q84K47.1 RecName: Full=ABC transporter A family member 2; Short=ABC transporter ABCA.2; Short=AtABCA2; AltName: Full=ABC2 homolog 1 [Arabidopsis thaliana]KAG7627679.1 ABC transporter-like [Arabidopsis thaliana x Arabidopsis arenosa]KAG7633620.1 ABC transporter-like [Arabidopsis suecica]AAO42215.1 putative ABC transporter protein [Arabidopsis thaliana]AAO63876.1 putative ABC transporter protein [Arabidopsis thaliana]AEE78323.1 ATP-binding casset|eukprot:NP_190357.2 ATP-binding cassette A2 [Arabidopsis thaliana]